MDFPVDDQGNLIDSVFVDRWMADHDPITLMNNPEIYKHDIAMFIETTTGERIYNDFFHKDLFTERIPHTWVVTNGSHGIYESSTEEGLKFIDAAMDSALAQGSHHHDISLNISKHCLTSINVYSKSLFKPQVKVKNRGIEDQEDILAVCSIEQNGAVIYSDTTTIDTLSPNQSKEVQFVAWQPEYRLQSYDITFLIHATVDENQKNNTLKATLEISELVDDFESGTSNWTSESGWGLTDDRPHSGELCIDDSPFDFYENNADTWIMYRSSFDFSQLDEAHLSLWTEHWFAPDQDDYGFIELSVDSGATWEQLGNRFQDYQRQWKEEHRALSEYCGEGFENVWLRFHVISDSTRKMAGWKIDDIYIHPTSTHVEQCDNILPQSARLFDNYPNPFNAHTTIRFRLNQASHTSLEIYNSLGQKVITLCDEKKPAGDFQIQWDGRDERGYDAASGVYVYTLIIDEYTESKKMLMLK